MTHRAIYRVRPTNDYPRDELSHGYLWFSKPSGFKGDTNDANIGAFVTDTPAIKRGFEYARSEFAFEEWYQDMSHTGICCFTRKLPHKSKLRNFPGCSSGKAVCIEFNRKILESFFERHRQHPIVPCFRKVIYSLQPTKIESIDDWSILWAIGDGYKEYKTIPGILHSHPRVFDEFLYKLLTRISSRYKRQKEERIIIGAGMVPSDDPSLLGYKVSIPIESIAKIYVYPKVSEKWIKELEGIEQLRGKIVRL